MMRLRTSSFATISRWSFLLLDILLIWCTLFLLILADCFNFLLLFMDFCSMITLMNQCFYVYVFYPLTNGVRNCLFTFFLSVYFLSSSYSVRFFVMTGFYISHYLQHSVTDFQLCCLNLFPSFYQKKKRIKSNHCQLIVHFQ